MKILLYHFKSLFIVISLMAVGLLFSCKKKLDQTNASSKHTPAAAASALTTTATTYQLVWADEFDGSSVNTANWNFETGGGGWGNNEQEYYQAANATVFNGNLVITAKKQRVKSNTYTSARMTTKGKKNLLTVKWKPALNCHWCKVSGLLSGCWAPT
ncbi:MAG: hypothetical protein WKG06_35675 [Segetibacter sp.]